VTPSVNISEFDWLTLANQLERSSVDLLYADPPFNTGSIQSDRNGAFADSWPDVPSYIAWLRERFAGTLPALKPTASILLHLDFRSVHYAKVMLDELLGPDRFVNHLIWQYGLGGSSPRRFARKHDDILFYCIDPEKYWFDPPRVPATSRRMWGQMKKATDVLLFQSDEPFPLPLPTGEGSDVLDIPTINNMATERVGYPTQKPLALLELLIKACCPPGGLVLDPCCGSGTTLVAALNTGRRAIGCDVNPQAVGIARGRLDAAGGPDRPLSGANPA